VYFCLESLVTPGAEGILEQKVYIYVIIIANTKHSGHISSIY